MFTKKIIYYSFFYDVRCCKSLRLMIRITEEIYKSHRKNSKKLKKRKRDLKETCLKCLSCGTAMMSM